MFNTLVFARRLIEVGVPREQAEAHAQALADIVENDIATKNDLKNLEYRLILKLSGIMGTMITILGVAISMRN